MYICIMKAQVQSHPLLGAGIYTMPDISLILGIPYRKVSRWINTFWDERFGSSYGHAYSWRVAQTRAVNFHTLIELYIFYQLSAKGVSTRELLKAHEILSRAYNTPYPFATRNVLEGVRTDGKKILFQQKDGSIFSVDVRRQFHLEFVREFFKNLDFDSGLLASRYWPAGKNKTVVCDPHHQFGRPVIEGTNIQSETLYKMFLADEPPGFIASLYGLPEEKVRDAIAFHQKAA